MEFLKIPLKLFLLLAIITIFSKAWVFYSCSFRLDKIEPKELFLNHFKVDLSEKNLSDILDQKYKFLSKGRQSFAFVSNDDKYVLKLFRFHRYRESIFCNLISSFSFAKKYAKKIQDEKDFLYLESMNSYRLAYEKLKDETATVYVHLNKTSNLNKNFIIEDKFKNRHLVDLNELGFVIQKKAFSFKKALLNAKNDKKAIEDLLNSFFDNLFSIYSKNLLNKDRHVIQNLGVVDNRVVEVDIGRFIIKNDFDENTIKKETYHYTKYLKKWLLKNMPNSIEFLDEKLLCITSNENPKTNKTYDAT